MLPTSTKARVYIGITFLGGLLSLSLGLLHGEWTEPSRYICYLALALLASGMKVSLPGVHGTMSVIFLFILIGVRELTLAQTLLMGVLGTMIQCYWKPKTWPKPIQVAFNILRQEAKNQLFREATKNNVGIVAREPLANGFLAGKLKSKSTFPQGDIRHNFPPDYISQLILAADRLRFLESNKRTLAQATLRFVLDHKDISTVIPGTKTREQVDEDFASSESPPLTGEELLRIKFLREQAFA